jgi:prepilin-type N-terminal cleavage/methylation domain-containing protein
MRRVREALRRRGDEGMSLVEVLVVIMLLGIVGTITLRSVIDSGKLVRIVNDQSDGLADVRIALERVARDARDARSVLCNPAGTPAALLTDTTCQYHLQLWIDYDSDYVKDTSEVVTWNLQPGSNSGQYDLVRRVQSGTTQVQARTIVSNVAFTYDLPPGATEPVPGDPHTTIVNVNMSYDALTNTGTRTRTVTASARLRNVR